MTESELLGLVRELVVAHHFTGPSPAEFQPVSVDEINAALRRLDPYSRYLPEPAVQPAPSGDFGIDLIPIRGQVLLIPRKDGPLYRAGYRDQQILVSIDSVNVASESLHEIGARLGQAALSGGVWLGLRASLDAPIKTVRLLPATISRSPIETLRVGGHKYIRIHGFVSHETRLSLAAALESMLTSADRIVLDLRYASGGDLFEVMDAASLFLRAGLILASTVDGDGERRVYRAPAGMQLVFRPVLLLIGPGTLSASEVFVRALQRYGMAFTIGTRTRGKCVAQRKFHLPNDALLSLSNRRILDPDGRYCDGQGIPPDLAVEYRVLGDTLGLIRRGNEAISTAGESRILSRPYRLPASW